MICSLTELRDKEIIDITNGVKLGFVDDIEIDTEKAAVIALIVYGRPRFFGLFGRDEDMIVHCSEIEIIGEDTILIRPEELTKRTKHKGFSFESLYQ